MKKRNWKTIGKKIKKLQNGGTPFDLNMEFLTQNFTPAEIDTITGGMYNAGADYLAREISRFTPHWVGQGSMDAAAFTGLIDEKFADLIVRGKQGFKGMGKKKGIDDIDAMRVLLDAGIPKEVIMKWFSDQGVTSEQFSALSPRMDDYWSDDTRKRGGSVGTKKIFKRKKGGNVGGSGTWKGRSVPGMKYK